MSLFLEIHGEDPLDKEDSHAASLSNGFMFNLMMVSYIVDW